MGMSAIWSVIEALNTLTVSTAKVVLWYKIASYDEALGHAHYYFIAVKSLSTLTQTWSPINGSSSYAWIIICNTILLCAKNENEK